MRMGIVTAILHIHMLLWAGCNAASSVHKRGSGELLLRNAQPSRILWRKLLNVNTSNPDVIKAETTNASIDTQSNRVEAQDTHTQLAKNADVKEENVVLDAKIEMAKTESAPLVALQEEAKSENLAPYTPTENINAAKQEEPKSQEAPKEEVSSEKTDGKPIKGSGNIEKTENSTSEAIAKSQVEEIPTPITIEDDAKVSEKAVETQENALQTSLQNVKDENSGQTEEKQVQIALIKEEAPGAKTGAEENKDGSDVDTQNKVPADVKEEVSAVAVAEEKKNDSAPAQAVEENKSDSTPEQNNAAPDDVKLLGGDQHDTPSEGSRSVIENTETKEQPTEDNTINKVETDGDGKQTDLNDQTKIKLVQSSEPEGDDKHQIALGSPASVEQQNSSNKTDNSNGEASDIKVDDEKREEKTESSTDNSEIAEKKDKDNNSKEGSQEKIDENKEEKRELSDDNAELKDKESESKDSEEASQVKSDEKAEENHELSGEKAAENHEPGEANSEVKDKEGEGGDAEEVLQTKIADETQAATNEVESQLEALRETVFDNNADDRRQERDPSEDEYDIIQELADLPTKFQETAGKVADHLRPDLLRWTGTSKQYFNLANQQISESFSPLIGKQYAPFFASMISYGVLLLPLLVVILLFDHIKALFSLQKVLLFINIYLVAYFATLWLASFIIGLEPMSFFYHNSLSSYLSLQLLQALGYVIYLILQTANMINSCSSETRAGKATSGLQWVVAMGIGLHYYVTVFHPAVASKPPHTSWKFYAIYSAAFFILCFFARIRWVKKQYVTSGNDMTNKKS